jgi:hypothetical protein
MNPCLYFFEYSYDVLKKKIKVLDIFNTDRKCLMKIDIESSPPEIWILDNMSKFPLDSNELYIFIKNIKKDFG